MLKKKIKKQLLVIAILMFVPCLVRCQIQKKAEGIVEFVYEQDSVWHRYFSKQTTIKLNGKVYFFVSDPLMAVAKLDLKCGEKYKILLYNGKENIVLLSELKQFLDSMQLMDNYYLHQGGDIYRVNKNTISIVFHVTAYFAILTEKPCDDFYYGRVYSCPIEYDKSFYPMAIMIGATKAKSLSRRERKKMHLRRFENTFFEEGICD